MISWRSRHGTHEDCLGKRADTPKFRFRKEPFLRLYDVGSAGGKRRGGGGRDATNSSLLVNATKGKELAFVAESLYNVPRELRAQ